MLRQSAPYRLEASVTDAPTVQEARRLMDSVRPSGGMILHGEAFDRIVEILQQPGEPTPELRKLTGEAYEQQAPATA